MAKESRRDVRRRTEEDEEGGNSSSEVCLLLGLIFCCTLKYVIMVCQLMPLSQKIATSRFVLNQIILTLTKFVEKIINIYDTKVNIHFVIDLMIVI